MTPCVQISFWFCKNGGVFLGWCYFFGVTGVTNVTDFKKAIDVLTFFGVRFVTLLKIKSVTNVTGIC